MPLFLITFLTLYGGIHSYAFFRLRNTFFQNRPASVILASLMVLMTVAPILVRMSENSGFERTAKLIAWPAYIWMGSIFIFWAILSTIDALRIVAWISQHIWGTGIPRYLTSDITCKVALFLALLASCYAIYDARKIRTEHITVSTAKLPTSFRGIRVIQISDVHLGLLFRESRLESVLKAVRAAHPDILVSTGDLVDGRLSREDVISQLDPLADMIAAIPTRIGKFAVTGNHEYYAGLDQALKFTRKAGFTVLRNQAVTLPNDIIICGVDDSAGERFEVPISSPTESELLQSLSTDSFKVFLKHRPLISAKSDGLFDLQLSGHVHKGQIFPFNLLVRLKFPIPCGTTVTQHHSTIHVSRGSGTWGPPMRLLATPEVTIIDIIPSPP